MQWRALLIALAVLIGLGSWVWWSHQDQSDPEDSNLLLRMFPKVDPAAVTRLSIVEGQRQLVVEQNEAGSSRWRIVGQPPRPASEAHVQAAIRAAAELSSRRRFPAIGDGSSYGFSDLSPRVVLEGSGGVLAELLIGSALPVGNGRYVRDSGASEVAVVSNDQLVPLEREHLDFRDRRVIGLLPDQIQRLRVSGAQGLAFTIQRSADRGFSIETSAEEPLLRADTVAVKGLLLDLAELTASRVADSTESPGGTNQPTLTIELGSAQGQEAVLRFGAESPDGDRYIVASGNLLPPGVGDEIVLVAAEAFEKLATPAAALRSLELFDFEPGSVSSVSWAVQGLSGRLEHRAGNWQGSNESDQQVDGDLVDEILAEFRATKALRIVAEGADPEEAGVMAAQLSLVLRDGSEQGLRLLRGATADSVVVNDEPGLWEVAPELVDLFDRLSALSSNRAEQEPVP